MRVLLFITVRTKVEDDGSLDVFLAYVGTNKATAESQGARSIKRGFGITQFMVTFEFNVNPMSVKWRVSEPSKA